MTDVLTKPELELEGTWEEILAHTEELKGRRVRVVVLPAEIPLDETLKQTSEHQGNGTEKALSPENQRMLELVRQWKETPLTDEEITVLDEMEEFTRTHRFTLQRGTVEA